MHNFTLAIALLLAAGLLGPAAGWAADPQALVAQVQEEAREGGYQILHTEELWQQLQQDPGGVLLVDTRQDWEHRSGHIAGSLHYSMEPTWWARWRSRGPLERLLGEDRTILVAFY